MNALAWLEAEDETRRATKTCVRCKAKHGNEGWYCDGCLGRAPESQAERTDMSGAAIDGKKHVCPICREEFASGQGLGAHKRHRHGIAGSTSAEARLEKMQKGRGPFRNLARQASGDAPQVTPPLPADTTLTPIDALRESAIAAAARESDAFSNACDDAIIAARKEMSRRIGAEAYERILPLLDLCEAAVRAGSAE